jgi:hypothetical protein
LLEVLGWVLGFAQAPKFLLQSAESTAQLRIVHFVRSFAHSLFSAARLLYQLEIIREFPKRVVLLIFLPTIRAFYYELTHEADTAWHRSGSNFLCACSRHSACSL